MMHNDLLNILSNSNKDIDNQLLMDYLQGKLSETQKHELEKQMASSDFTHDALEGLEDIKDKERLGLYVDQLNKQLHNQLEEKKQRRKEKKLPDQTWIYVAIILLLTLCIIGYTVIRMYLRR